MPRKICRKILTALLLTAFLGPMANAATAGQLAMIPNPSTEVKELILEAFLFPDDYRERISEYCSNMAGLPTGTPVPLNAQSLKPSNPQSRTFNTEYETLIKAPNPQQNGQKGNGGKGATSLSEVSKSVFGTGKLPENYITKEEALKLGWDPSKGNLWEVAPGKRIGGDVFQNRPVNGVRPLPEGPGRIWFEADLNYSGGYRGSERILYSNDGLIFYSGDHYKTFQMLGSKYR